MISLIIPTLGRSTLEEVINSINGQEIENWTLILIDDSSEGLNQKRIHSISTTVSHKFVYLRTSGMVGPSKARNLGLDNVVTEWVAFADDDDPWAENRIRKQFLLMDKLGLNASTLLDSKNVSQKIVWDGLESPLHFLYAKPGFLRNRRYIPFGTLVYNFEIYNKVRFNVNQAEREDLCFLYDLYRTNTQIRQLPIIGCHVTKNRFRSINRPTHADDIGWYQYLSSIEKKLARNFLIYVSLRNSLATLNLKKLYKTLKYHRNTGKKCN